ncbi:MAG: isoprenylcysteine carboxylmethyltransferase family protein [Acidobacteriota bacterium]
MSRLVRVGGWLFRRRTSIPIPLVLALILIPGANPSGDSRLLTIGFIIVGIGELLRLWAVRHIGVISRTRSDRLGPLVSTGPFAFVRNPLYLGNIALWVGFAVSAHLVWLVPIFIVVLSLEYHAIVRWEEELLGSRRQDEYREYAARVPRWIPSVGGRRPAAVDNPSSLNSWPDTFFSERGTLITIAVGFTLIWLKNHA